MNKRNTLSHFFSAVMLANICIATSLGNRRLCTKVFPRAALAIQGRIKWFGKYHKVVLWTLIQAEVKGRNIWRNAAIRELPTFQFSGRWRETRSENMRFKHMRVVSLGAALISASTIWGTHTAVLAGTKSAESSEQSGNSSEQAAPPIVHEFRTR